MKVITETLHRVLYMCYLRVYEIIWNSLIVYSSLSNLLDPFDFRIHVSIVELAMSICMKVCVSCPVYIVVHLMLFQYVYSLLSLLCIFCIC